MWPRLSPSSARPRPEPHTCYAPAAMWSSSAPAGRWWRSRRPSDWRYPESGKGIGNLFRYTGSEKTPDPFFCLFLSATATPHLFVPCIDVDEHGTCQHPALIPEWLAKQALDLARKRVGLARDFESIGDWS